MSVLRVHKKENPFVILDKTCLQDKRLSWGAKGLHAYLMSLPDDWHVRVCQLQEVSTNGRDSVRALLKELELAGYIKKTAKRIKENGRFGGFEFLVFEVPELSFGFDDRPSPEKASSVKNNQYVQMSPTPGNPSTGTPTPEKTLQINNKLININKLNKKTAAERTNSNAENVHVTPQAAAVIFPHSLHPKEQLSKFKQNFDHVETLSQNDAFIGLKLTETQKQRITALVNNLNVSKKEALRDEIEFCLLNFNHFTACGKDFSRKLNAIRGVILRGDWQTPVGMVLEVSEAQHPCNLAVKMLKNELREVHAETSHFKKLLATAKEHTRAHFEMIISQAQNKIHDIEEQLRHLLSQKKEASG